MIIKLYRRTGAVAHRIGVVLGSTRQNRYFLHIGIGTGTNLMTGTPLNPICGCISSNKVNCIASWRLGVRIPTESQRYGIFIQNQVQDFPF